MQHLAFVYGTLLTGEVNHHLLAAAELLGAHRTEPRFTMFGLGAYPGVTWNGGTAISGEVYRIDRSELALLDRLEDYPRLFDRILILTPFGHAWIYLFRGRIHDRSVIRSGSWREMTGGRDRFRAAAVRTVRDPKNPRWRERLAS